MEFMENPPNSSTLNAEQEQEEEEDEENNVKEESGRFPGCSIAQETKASRNSKKTQKSNNVEQKGIKIYCKTLQQHFLGDVVECYFG